MWKQYADCGKFWCLSVYGLHNILPNFTSSMSGMSGLIIMKQKNELMDWIWGIRCGWYLLSLSWPVINHHMWCCIHLGPGRVIVNILYLRNFFSVLDDQPFRCLSCTYVLTLSCSSQCLEISLDLAGLGHQQAQHWLTFYVLNFAERT